MSLVNSCARYDPCPFEEKVFAPTISSRVEKGDQLSGLGRYRTEVRAFEAIAECAGPSEVSSIGQATVFLADNVIRLASEERILLVNQAVFLAEPIHLFPMKKIRYPILGLLRGNERGYGTGTRPRGDEIDDLVVHAAHSPSITHPRAIARVIVSA